VVARNCLEMRDRGLGLDPTHVLAGNLDRPIPVMLPTNRAAVRTFARDLLARVSAIGVPLAELRSEQPSLEQVFLALTGHREERA